MTTQSKDALGISTLPPGFAAPFAVPSHAGSDAGIGANASTIAPDSGAGAGTPRDMGALALFLVANWFVNGETVLIDGGVRPFHSFPLLHFIPFPRRHYRANFIPCADPPQTSIFVLNVHIVYIACSKCTTICTLYPSMLFM
jgi:hypothetical protein